MGAKVFGKSFNENVLVVGRDRYWAERGLIHCDGPSGYNILSVTSFLRRLKAICGMVGNSSAKGDTPHDANLRAQYLNLVDTGMRIAEVARVQGTPDDPAACREYVRRRSKTLCMSDNVKF